MPSNTAPGRGGSSVAAHQTTRGICDTVIGEYDHVPEYETTRRTIVDELQLRCAPVPPPTPPPTDGRLTAAGSTCL